jgi:acyl-CoA reductase-like NAD-dependent aldehyde dehydrogenase
MRIGGEWVHAAEEVEIVDPFRGVVVARSPVSGLEHVDAALEAAVRAKAVMAAMPGYQRARRLREAARLLRERGEMIAETMAREIGKAIRDCRAELDRSEDTILLSAEEAIRIEGEHAPLDGSPMGAGKICMLMRFPVGVVVGITPFNAPLNLACHKVAPALAAGNAVVLKASPQAPLVVHRLTEVFVDAGFPPGAINTLHGNTAGPALVRSDLVDFISFTGSSRAGAAIKASSGLKRVALELGGVGATIVHRDADVDAAARVCATNATRLAGQSCISVQNIYVDNAVAADFMTALAGHVGKLRVGDPLAEDTDVGTLIDEAAARRVENWVEEARTAGARVLVGGKREGARYWPTILTDVDATMKVVCEEIFGPVANVIGYENIDQAVSAINASPFGLQAGIFTRDIAVAIDAYRRIRVGGFIVNGTSTWRTDQLPYGGVKASGIGREGPKYAIRDMTEERFILFNI